MLEKLRGQFWTDEDEMVQDIERETGYELVDGSYESLILENDEGETLVAKLIRARSTIAIDYFVKECF